jgi:predicted Zn-dependent peptidase
MRAYYDRRYVAPNILLSVAGRFDWPAFVRLAEEKCGHWPAGDAPRGSLTNAPGVGGTHLLAKDGVAQEHVMVISPGPAAEDPMRYAAAALALAVGDDSGSRFYWELVNPGAVESASCGIDQNQAAGTVASTFSCEPAKAAENLATVRRVLADVQRDGITAEELEQAKSKIASRVVRHSERPMGRMRSIATAWMYNGEYHDIDTELARFDAVDLRAVRAVLDRFPLTAATTVAYGPLAAVE